MASPVKSLSFKKAAVGHFAFTRRLSVAITRALLTSGLRSRVLSSSRVHLTSIVDTSFKSTRLWGRTMCRSKLIFSCYTYGSFIFTETLGNVQYIF